MCFSQHISCWTSSSQCKHQSWYSDLTVLSQRLHFLLACFLSLFIALPWVFHVGMDPFYLSKPINVKTSTCSPFTPMFYFILLVRVGSLWQTPQTQSIAVSDTAFIQLCIYPTQASQWLSGWACAQLLQIFPQFLLKCYSWPSTAVSVNSWKLPYDSKCTNTCENNACSLLLLCLL